LKIGTISAVLQFVGTVPVSRDVYILSDSQNGFRARRSCETQLVVTIQKLAKTQSEGKQIDAILLDFSKAFDKVPHNRLLLKLYHYKHLKYGTI
jgi:hypothetical protein